MSKERLIFCIAERLECMSERQLRLVLSFIKGFNYNTSET